MNLKFYYKVTNDPIFPAVVVFSLLFLISGVLVEFSSLNDNGERCSKYSSQDLRVVCTKVNALLSVLAVSVPVIAGIITYGIGRGIK